MFVHLDALNPREVEHLARLHHRFGQPADFPVRHAGEEDRHEKGRHLVVGYFSASVPVHQVRNLFGGQFSAVALSLNQVYCTHYEALSVPFTPMQSKEEFTGRAVLAVMSTLWHNEPKEP